MSTTKTLHTFTARLANDKVATTTVVENAFGRNASRMVDIHVKVTGHEAMIENVGSIETSSYPGTTHAFYPALKVKQLGLSFVRGSLNDVRTQAITAAAFRMGALAAQVAAAKVDAA